MKKNYLKRTMKRITKTGMVCLLSLGMMGALAGCGDDYSEYDEEYEDAIDINNYYISPESIYLYIFDTAIIIFSIYFNYNIYFFY